MSAEPIDPVAVREARAALTSLRVAAASAAVAGGPLVIDADTASRLATSITETLAALTSSKAEIERVKEQLDFARTASSYCQRQFDASEARVATLTAEVGRMREALTLAEDILSRNGSFSTAPTWLTKDGETHPMSAITTLRAALASPIEPEGG